MRMCHSDLPFFSVLSLPAGSLDTTRMQGRPGEISDSRLNGWNFLRSLGLGSEDPPSGGRPLIRGEAGHVVRWGEEWFVEVRDGVGWGIARKDDVQVEERVAILLRLWFHKRPQLPLMLENGEFAVVPAILDS